MCYPYRVALRIRASSATVGARHASPDTIHREIIAMRVEPRQRRWWVLLAHCKTLGETQSKNGHNPKVMPVVFIGGVPWRAATIAMLSENAQRAFYGRIRFRPYRIGIQ